MHQRKHCNVQIIILWKATSLLLVNTSWKVHQVIFTSRKFILTVIAATAKRSISTGSMLL